MQIKTIHGWDIYLSSRTGKFSAQKEDEESLSAETLEGITTEIERKSDIPKKCDDAE